MIAKRNWTQLKALQWYLEASWENRLLFQQNQVRTEFEAEYKYAKNSS
jgi:hypothetical protein